jgi:hypoxanthine phosphoribosyltransferase
MTHLDLLISSEQIRKKIAAVGQELDQLYSGQELTILMVMKGAICLVADLIREIHLPCAIEFMRASSYGHRGTQKGELVLSGLDELNLKDKNILLVDDIFDSGETFSQIIPQLLAKQPKTLKSLVLLSRKIPKHTRVKPDIVLFEIENQFVVGYGLDYKEHYRGLPGVYAFYTDESI